MHWQSTLSRHTLKKLHVLKECTNQVIADNIYPLCVQYVACLYTDTLNNMTINSNTKGVNKEILP